MDRVLIAMSGGVDSSVAAYLLQQQGDLCAGGNMRLWCEGGSQSTDDAKSVAQRLDIPFYVFDRQDDFRQKVIDPFIRVYENGGTPNPCIFCNRHLKFSALLEDALSMGFTHIATGHYARIKKDGENGRYLLYRAADDSKDQSYFLACLTQHQLKHTKFPLGGLTKPQVREIAQAQGFLNARKRDSQDICFIPDGDYVSFMKRYTGKSYPTGDYLDLEGKVLGTHRGAVCYTIGQRKGLGIALGEPAFVCRKDMQQNTVTLGKEDALMHTGLIAGDWNWISFPALTAPLEVMAKVRYRHTPQPATVYPLEDGTAKVIFRQPQRAITSGQAVVLYDGDLVVGSGTITQIL